MNDVAKERAPWPMVLIGEPGSGKTCAAIAFGGLYITAPDFCTMLIDAQQGQLRWSSGYPRTTVEISKAWRCAGRAILDELGARDRVSDFHFETVKRAMDLREGRATIYVSNHGLDRLAEIYDDRIASRLSAGTVIEMRGDRRAKH